MVTTHGSRGAARWLLLAMLAMGCSSTMTPGQATGGASGSSGGATGSVCPPGQHMCSACGVALGCYAGFCPAVLCVAQDGGSPPPADAGATDAGGCAAGDRICYGCSGEPVGCSPVCPTFDCPVQGVDGGATAADAGASASCADLTTLAACDARADCHAVFTDPGTCGCAVSGCCAHFTRCEDGATANCKGPALCKSVAPFCESPYVVAYGNACYDGCVRNTVCAP
jgi:hypothetical protein